MTLVIVRGCGAGGACVEQWLHEETRKQTM